MDRLWAMKVFSRVVECGSFSKAADSLDLANATVTGCVRNLEKHLGVTLIQRNTRFLNLTDEGTLYFQRCLEMLRGVEQAEAEVRSKLGEVAGTIRVEAPVAIALSLVCPMLPSFAKRHPSLSVAMSLINKPQNIIEHATDVALRMDQVDDADLVARPVYRAKYVVCASPGWLAQNRLPDSPRDLDPRACLGLLDEGRYVSRSWTFRRGDEHVELRPQGPLNFNSTQALILAAIQGTGLIQVLDVFVNPHVANGELQHVYAEWDSAGRTFYAVTPKARFVTPKVRAFIEFLSEVLDAQRGFQPTEQVAIRSARGHRRR
jgi:LysR family transcriptional regulator for bpeEF and oprC